jgi:sigma-B regulation protein RsbU (phosphoserine phosphatase)
MKISLVTYDKGSQRMINIYSSDRTESPGYWYQIERDNTIFRNPGANLIYDTDIPYILNKDENGYRCTSWTKADEDEDTITMVTAEIDMYKADDAAINFLLQFLGLLMSLTLIVFFFIDRRLKKEVVKPILDMNQAARNYIADKDDGLPDEYHFQALDIHTNDEIESLALIFGDMEREIGQYVENMTRATAERERINSELNVAAQIQRGTLPSVFPPYPDKKEFEIYASVVPAKEVGGDFYDFFLVDDDHLALVVADVSGKGIPAALFMMACKILISNLASIGITDPATILNMVNNRIIKDNPLDMFITVWLGILDIKSGKLLAANGGHEYPCLRTDGKNYEILKDRHGLVLGGMADSVYYTYEIQLKPGDALFVYSDGVPESTSTRKELFGLDRMLESLNRNIDQPLDKLLAGVKEDIDAFVGEAPQFDDITMLALRYNGCGTKARKITLTAVNENCAEATQMVLSLLELNGYDSDKLKMQVEVTVEEIFVNIASYAYNGEPGEVTLTARISGDPESLTVVFEDGGAPFDPLSKKDPDLSIPIEERRIGGLGIYLIKDNMDDIRYEYKGRKNVLTITKILTREQQ